MTLDKMRRLYDAIMSQPGQTVVQYNKITGIPRPEINDYLNKTVDGASFVYQKMVAISSRGRLPRWALDKTGNPREDIPVVESSGKALVRLPDVFETGEKSIDGHTNRFFQGVKELVVAKPSERQAITDRLGEHINASAEALIARDRQIEAWRLTAESLKATTEALKDTVKATERLAESKDEIILLLKKAAKG